MHLVDKSDNLRIPFEIRRNKRSLKCCFEATSRYSRRMFDNFEAHAKI